MDVLRTEKEELIRLIQVLKQKPEIDQKIEYYKGVIRSTGNLINSIIDKVEKGYITKTYKVLFLKIVSKQPIDDYAKAKLEIERFDSETTLFMQQKYYETWLKRSSDYEKEFEKVSKECNEHFENIFIQAKELAKKQVRLASTIQKWEADENKKDQENKNLFYLTIKSEVINHEMNKSGRVRRKSLVSK